MQKNDEKKLLALLGRILKIAPEKITDAMAPENTEEWDSFNGLMIAAELEKTFNIKFSIEEIITTKNVGDIKNNLKKHGIIL